MMRSLTLIILFAIPSWIFGHDIVGKIVDTSQRPISGAYVLSLSSEYHTHTNDFGRFMITDVAIGDTLKIMHLGYETAIAVLDNLDDELVIELEEAVFDLNEVVVDQQSKEINIISAIDIQLAPVNSSQEVLQKVPGLFIGQHAGGGKAEQIFLRGFDIDHGTDINLTVDGMPVNMVSHAHGQGYADLHFVIPETIETVDFAKGPYDGDKGNFTTAGYVEFKTKDALDESMVSVDFGRFGALRALGMFKLVDSEKHQAYVASEYQIRDGAFESSQHFSRKNILLKYNAKLNSGRFSFLASHFDSRWDASGQIPQRAVDQGLITRFGAIDDTEGGETGRTNLSMRFDRIIDDNTYIKNQAYYSLYDFELFSNFTFFLEDPINGDQIRQTEKREIFGFESVLNKSVNLNNSNLLLQWGIGFRNDLVTGNELARTLNRRTTLSSIQLGDVDEKNFYSFLKGELRAGNWQLEPSLRVDYFRFNYVNSLDSLYDNQFQDASIWSPKLKIGYNLSSNAQLFVKTGIGFHSNDTRVVLAEEADAILPAALGADVGGLFKPTKKILLNLALWYLALEQEFVYVGDAGIVEPSGSTRRLGVDASVRMQFNDWLFANADFNYAYARSVEDPEGENLIPLAPIITSTAGLHIKRSKFRSSIQARYLQDRPANEDNSIVAEGYLITDWSASYDLNRMTVGFAIENLFNSEWKETQFATESRLRTETTSVEEIHFTPGTPFFIRGILKYRF